MSVLTVLAVSTLVGCAAEPVRASAGSYVGRTVAEAIKAAPEGDAANSYDLSTEVLDEEPTMDAATDAPSSFEVVAACYDGAELHLGVIPLTGVTNDIRERARAGEYDKLVPGCN
ncbi:hypothetical protein SAMN04488590_3586 [Microbacterium sp. 77mftsu3.1]|nr:hypothetical protein SAMN04488590_3586 [Microbacterium sp. 77mftsu3.1]